MTIFVSDLFKAGGMRWRCLFSDAGEGGDAELHAFAQKIGVSPDRYRGPRTKLKSRRAAWSHYRIGDALAGAAFRAGAVKADQIKLVECSSGKRAAQRLAKRLSREGDAA